LIKVQSEDFNLEEELITLTHNREDIGGVASFVGLVRKHNQKGPITSMVLEHYPAMTEQKLSEIEKEAHRRWPLQASLIIHRYGTLLPGDRIVLVATASSHRQAALEACAFLIDWLKTKAPFWKLENGVQGSHWVEAKTFDIEEADKWKE